MPNLQLPANSLALKKNSSVECTKIKIIITLKSLGVLAMDI